MTLTTIKLNSEASRLDPCFAFGSGEASSRGLSRDGVLWKETPHRPRRCRDWCVGKRKHGQSLAAGFTLMELIIYIAIAAIVLSTLASVSVQLITHLNRSSARAQVRRDLVAVIERLKQEAHYARAINTTASVFNAHPGKLQLDMPDVQIRPTIFETVASGLGTRLTIRQGTGAQQFLTADTVDVDRLVFYDLSGPFAPLRAFNVRAVIRLKYRNPDALSDFAYSMTATTSIEFMNR